MHLRTVIYDIVCKTNVFFPSMITNSYFHMKNVFKSTHRSITNKVVSKLHLFLKIQRLWSFFLGEKFSLECNFVSFIYLCCCFCFVLLRMINRYIFIFQKFRSIRIHNGTFLCFRVHNISKVVYLRIVSNEAINKQMQNELLSI